MQLGKCIWVCVCWSGPACKAESGRGSCGHGVAVRRGVGFVELLPLCCWDAHLAESGTQVGVGGDEARPRGTGGAPRHVCGTHPSVGGTGAGGPHAPLPCGRDCGRAPCNTSTRPASNKRPCMLLQHSTAVITYHSTVLLRLSHPKCLPHTCDVKDSSGSCCCGHQRQSSRTCGPNQRLPFNPLLQPPSSTWHPPYASSACARVLIACKMAVRCP